MKSSHINSHTNAPWTWNDGEALKGPDNALVLGIMRTPSERDANRRLIQAAPELLEACKAALRLSEANLSELLDGGEQEQGANVQAERENIKTFTAAIAKAEGK